MSRYHSYLNSAERIIKEYNGDEPFASFLKKEFAANKKYGSKDRKQISHLCYCFFRLGKMTTDLPVSERIILALFLCAASANEMLAALNPTWNEQANKSIGEKMLIAGQNASLSSIFPWKDRVSDGLDYEQFCKSFLVQPDLFLRIRPGKKGIVFQQLKNHSLDYVVISDTCIGLPNASKIDEVLRLDEEVVIQDYNSQRTMVLVPPDAAMNIKTVWDCCAASGGKSILATDVLSAFRLTVSDVRDSILHNLKNRFFKAGITNYRSFVADLSKPFVRKDIEPFDLIIADVPCSGSGTWSRTPEQIYFFDEQKIEAYSTLQKKIIQHVVPFMKQGAYLLYITCSVFADENENNINAIQQLTGLELNRMQLLTGYEQKADTLFTALLQKKL